MLFDRQGSMRELEQRYVLVLLSGTKRQLVSALLLYISYGMSLKMCLVGMASTVLVMCRVLVLAGQGHERHLDG